MGNSATVVVAEIVMQNIEEQALATYKRTIKFGYAIYVDDRFTAVHKDEIDDFHEHLNRQNAENCKIPFLDCIVTRHNNRLRTIIYIKPTNTDRLIRPVIVQPDLSQGYN